MYLEYTKVHSSVRDLFDRVVYRFGILVGIGWYFLGILPTDTEGKLGWYISVLKNWREPDYTHIKRGFVSVLYDSSYAQKLAGALLYTLKGGSFVCVLYDNDSSYAQ